MWCAIFFFLSLDGKVIYFMIHLLKVNIVSLFGVIWGLFGMVILNVMLLNLTLWYLICDQWLVEYLICDICDWLILMYVKSDVIGCWFFWSVIGWFKGCDVNLCPVIGWFQNVTWNLQCDWLLTPCDWVDKCWVGGSRLWTLLFRFGDFCIAFCKLQP